MTNPPMSRRTRIVATLGPATDSPEILREVLLAGVDVARINFSHGNAEEHLKRIDLLRKTAAEIGRNVAVLADLPGPKLRVKIPEPRDLVVGQEIGFRIEGDPAGDLTITEPEMLHDVQSGHRVLLDDGRLQLIVVRVDKQRIVCKVTVGGKLLPNKGLNLPDTPLTIPALTDRDREAIAVAAKGGIDWLALSFVRKPEAATELREAAKKEGLDVPVLAKLERPEAVERAAEIIAAFDGVMVARGDLGVEIPLERVPTAQKRMIALARAAGKPVITATDMLDSMRQNPRPTRAEAGDVANAIYDGTDAVMLSGETAVGQFPVESVACMSRIAREAESHLVELGHSAELRLAEMSVDDHITQTVVELADRVRGGGDYHADAFRKDGPLVGPSPSESPHHRPGAERGGAAANGHRLGLATGLDELPPAQRRRPPQRRGLGGLRSQGDPGRRIAPGAGGPPGGGRRTLADDPLDAGERAGDGDGTVRERSRSIGKCGNHPQVIPGCFANFTKAKSIKFLTRQRMVLCQWRSRIVKPFVLGLKNPGCSIRESEHDLG